MSLEEHMQLFFSLQITTDGENRILIIKKEIKNDIQRQFCLGKTQQVRIYIQSGQKKMTI